MIYKKSDSKVNDSEGSTGSTVGRKLKECIKNASVSLLGTTKSQFQSEGPAANMHVAWLRLTQTIKTETISEGTLFVW
jgi:hypothetical protein